MRGTSLMAKCPMCLIQLLSEDRHPLEGCMITRMEELSIAASRASLEKYMKVKFKSDIKKIHSHLKEKVDNEFQLR